MEGEREGETGRDFFMVTKFELQTEIVNESQMETHLIVSKVSSLEKERSIKERERKVSKSERKKLPCNS